MFTLLAAPQITEGWPNLTCAPFSNSIHLRSEFKKLLGSLAVELPVHVWFVPATLLSVREKSRKENCYFKGAKVAD